MDQTAITLCKENKLPIIVLNIHTSRRGRAGAAGRARRNNRTMTTIPQIIEGLPRPRWRKSFEASKRELASIRTGKATASLLDTVRVEAYGQTMPLNQVASVSAPEPRLLTVTPWDKGLITGDREGAARVGPRTQPADPERTSSAFRFPRSTSSGAKSS